METYEIEAVLIINAYLARHHIFTNPLHPTEAEAHSIHSIYNFFLSSSYNLPYLPLRTCLESYLEFLYKSGELAFRFF